MDTKQSTNTQPSISSSKDDFMELPIIAVILAIAAGAMDGYAYFTTKTFATFQSGNIILSGYTFASDDAAKLVPTLCSILAFGLGAVALAFIRDASEKKNKIWTFKILIIEMFILLFLITNDAHKLLTPLHIAWALSFVAGMQGNAFHKIDKMLYGNIAVTLNVQLAFGFFADGLVNGSKRMMYFKKAFDYFIVLVGFAFGAGLAAILTNHLGSYTMILIIAPLLVIFIIGKGYAKKHPSQIDLD